jgi:hypothetical protein
MRIWYSDSPVVDLSHRSIFLGGPTPRKADVVSWRPRALEILEKLQFEGDVLVPERKDWVVEFNYLHQVEWEYFGLESSSVRVFWVPRGPDMPALTTNVEFGRYCDRGGSVYGRPPEAESVRYLDWLFGKFHDVRDGPFDTLERTLARAVELARRNHAQKMDHG